MAVEPTNLSHLPILDVLPALTAILDDRGVVTWTNRSWRANEVRAQQKVPSLGLSYFSVCEAARKTGVADMAELLTALSAVLSGQQPSFHLQYPCHSPSRRAWFKLSIYGLPSGGAIVVHDEISDALASGEQAALARLRQLWDAIDEGYCVVQLHKTSRGKLTARLHEHNAAFARFIASSGIANATPRGIFAGAERHSLELCWLAATTGESQRFTLSTNRSNRSWQVHASRVGGINDHHVALIFKETTEQLHAGINQKLLDLVGEITRREDDPAVVEQRVVVAVQTVCDATTFFARWRDGAISVTAPSTREYLVNSGDTATIEAVLLEETDLLRSGKTVERSFLSHDGFSSRSGVAVPLFREGELTAAMIATRDTSRGWRPDETATLITLAQRAWSAIEKKRANRELHESESRFRALANAITQLAWMADPSGYIYWYNQRWYDYTGETISTMAGMGWQIVHHPDHVDRVVKKYRECWSAKQPWEDLFPLRGADGEYRWFLSRAEPTFDAGGHIQFWVGTNTDVTEQMRIQNELRTNQKALHQSIQRKSEFLATLAHELRNPLAPIRAASQLLAANPSAQDVARISSTVQRQLSHLVHLTDDLLDIARVDTGKMRLRIAQVDVRDIVDQALEATRDLITTAGHVIAVSEVPEAVFVSGDLTRLVQVLVNLLTNATRYTPRPGRIEIRVQRLPGSLEISVQDSGIGVPADIQPHIFEIFSQAHRLRPQSKSGLGIGLALAKNIVELHHGQLRVVSEGEGRGSTFTVQLPLSNAMHIGSGDRGRRTPSTDTREPVVPLRVIVADDNEDAAEMMSLILQRLGHDVETAANGALVVEYAKRRVPDLILMDLGMPVLDGQSACRQIRTLLGGTRPMIAALTGWSQPDDVKASTAAGFDRHLVKPIAHEDLEDLLRAAAGRKAALESNSVLENM